MSVRLSVNVDHVATVRNARGTAYPDPVHAAVLAEKAGADSITAHLREDRRHIRERDVEILRAVVRTLDLEMARAPDVIELALKVQPDLASIVPEKRQEVTTESGLEVAGDLHSVTQTVQAFQEAGIPVSLFIDPDPRQLEAAAASGARHVELHTGPYSDATTEGQRARELERLRAACHHALQLGLRVKAGHGLRLDNVGPIAALPGMEMLSIGHSIIGHAIYVGMEQAVREMKEAMRV